MANRTITLFGGSGFIGRYIVRDLAQAGWTIRIAVREPKRARFLKPLGDVGQITPIPASLLHEDSVKAAVTGVDAVVNLVGILFERGRRSFEAVHVEGARRAALAAKEAGARQFMQISAIGADPNSDAAYARSKAAGEEAVKEAFPGATILRPSIVIGPEDDFFNRFGAMAQLAPALPLVGGGTTKFQPVYVGDVAEAAARLLNGQAEGGKTYELGGPQIFTFRELMELLLEEIGKKRLLIGLPSGIASLMGQVLRFLPNPPLTPDQVRLLRYDNVVGANAQGFAALGMTPQAIEAILPTYLDKYRSGGRFSQGTT